MRLVSSSQKPFFNLIRPTNNLIWEIVESLYFWSFADGTYMERNLVTRKYKMCHIKPGWSPVFIIFTAVPLLTVIVFNVTVLVHIVKTVHAKSRQAIRYGSDGVGNNRRNNPKQLLAGAKAVLILLPVLGVPWMLGLMTGWLLIVLIIFCMYCWQRNEWYKNFIENFILATWQTFLSLNKFLLGVAVAHIWP